MWSGAGTVVVPLNFRFLNCCRVIDFEKVCSLCESNFLSCRMKNSVAAVQNIF